MRATRPLGEGDASELAPGGRAGGGPDPAPEGQAAPDAPPPRSPSEGRRGVRAVEAKTALSPSGLEGLRWALNPYRGCAHACAYCYAPSVLRIERAGWGRQVEVRRNLPSLLAKELRRRERGVVGLATVTDPYQPAEAELGVTRLCLEQLLRQGWPVSVLTKGDLVVRDVDLLSRFKEAEVGFTITTLDEHQRRLLEPGAPPVSRRLAAMRLVAESGVRTYAFVGPVYPTSSVAEVRELVRKVRDAGGSSVMVDRLNLRPGVWDSVSRALAPDPALQGLARRRLFPRAGDEDFYRRALAAAAEEAEALGMGFSTAF